MTAQRADAVFLARELPALLDTLPAYAGRVVRIWIEDNHAAGDVYVETTSGTVKGHSVSGVVSEVEVRTTWKRYRSALGGGSYLTQVPNVAPPPVPAPALQSPALSDDIREAIEALAPVIVRRILRQLLEQKT